MKKQIKNEEENNPSYYAIIPGIIRYDRDLTPNAKLLYGEITALANKEGYCWASNEYFSNLYKKDKLTISRWISQLTKKKYIINKIEFSIIEKELNNGKIKKIKKSRRKIYINNTLVDENIKGGIDENIKGGIDENIKHNNTVINNTVINKSFNKLKDNRFEKPVNSDNSPNRGIKKTKQPKINNFTIKIINLWNNCPAVPTKHKIDRYYKFHSKVQKYITHLKAGTFGEIIDLSRDYMRRCSIMEKDLTKKYTETEIEKIVSNCLLAYKEGYWPTNKKILPKSISELFYTTPFYSTKYVPGESKSHFLYIHARPPRQLRKAKSSEAIDREMEVNTPVLTKEEKEALDKRLEILLENRCLPPHLRKEV